MCLEYDINDYLIVYGVVGYYEVMFFQSWFSVIIFNVVGDMVVFYNGYYDQKVVFILVDVGMCVCFNIGGIKYIVMLGVNMLDQQIDYFFFFESSSVIFNLYCLVVLFVVSGVCGEFMLQSQI